MVHAFTPDVDLVRGTVDDKSLGHVLECGLLPASTRGREGVVADLVPDEMSTLRQFGRARA